MGEKKTIRAGEKAALLLAGANTACYRPVCTVPLIVERAGHSVVNYEIAHIRDELSPAVADADIGWRYWPDDLSQAERNHFSNLLLLCSACHKLIDQIDPRAFTVDELHHWNRIA